MYSFVDNESSSNDFIKGKPVEITFCWASKWHVKMYEKLGWIALSVSNGYQNKAKNYLNGIDHLLISLKAKKEQTTGPDRIQDLNILISNISKLKEFANKLINKSEVRTSDTEEGTATPVTMKWLSKWYAMLYSKLGWMALVKSEGKKYKVRCYLRFINDLIASGRKKINELTDPDSIEDAKIIYNNSLKLKHFAEKLLL